MPCAQTAIGLRPIMFNGIGDFNVGRIRVASANRSMTAASVVSSQLDGGRRTKDVIEEWLREQADLPPLDVPWSLPADRFVCLSQVFLVTIGRWSAAPDPGADAL